ncbi:hypothetical protein [Ferruginibacter profundus]
MKATLLVLALFCYTFITAQKNNPVYIKADVGLSNVKTSSGKGSMEFALGIGLESYVAVKKSSDFDLSLNPVLSYLKTGYEQTAGGKVIVNYINLAMPLEFVVNPPRSGESIGIAFGAGPFVGYAVSGKFNLLSGDPYKKMSFGNGIADNRKSIDAGITLKSSIRLSKINMGMQYNWGLTNLVPQDRISNGSYIKSRNFLFYLSFAPGGKK